MWLIIGNILAGIGLADIFSWFHTGREESFSDSVERVIGFFGIVVLVLVAVHYVLKKKFL